MLILASSPTGKEEEDYVPLLTRFEPFCSCTRHESRRVALTFGILIFERLIAVFSRCRCEHVYVSAQLQIHVNEYLSRPFLSDIDHDGSYPQSHSGDDLLSTTEVDVYIYIYVYCLMCV